MQWFSCCVRPSDEEDKSTIVTPRSLPLVTETPQDASKEDARDAGPIVTAEPPMEMQLTYPAEKASSRDDVRNVDAADETGLPQKRGESDNATSSSCIPPPTSSANGPAPTPEAPAVAETRVEPENAPSDLPQLPEQRFSGQKLGLSTEMFSSLDYEAKVTVSRSPSVTTTPSSIHSEHFPSTALTPATSIGPSSPALSRSASTSGDAKPSFAAEDTPVVAEVLEEQDEEKEKEPTEEAHMHRTDTFGLVLSNASPKPVSVEDKAEEAPAEAPSAPETEAKEPSIAEAVEAVEAVEEKPVEATVEVTIEATVEAPELPEEKPVVVKNPEHILSSEEIAAMDKAASEQSTEAPVEVETASEAEAVPELPTVSEKAAEPTDVEEPVSEEATVEEPVAKEAAFEEPAVEKPATEEVTVEEPIAKEPVTEQITEAKKTVAPESDSEEEAAPVSSFMPVSSEAPAGEQRAKLLQEIRATSCKNQPAATGKPTSYFTETLSMLSSWIDEINAESKKIDMMQHASLWDQSMNLTRQLKAFINVGAEDYLDKHPVTGEIVPRDVAGFNKCIDKYRAERDAVMKRFEAAAKADNDTTAGKPKRRRDTIQMKRRFWEEKAEQTELIPGLPAKK